jgi:hypothetical protein
MRSVGKVRAGEAIAYLDNASIINALTVVSSPEDADPYKLLDLESFCEAFLFYDCVRTLTGHSFMSAVGSPGFEETGGRKSRRRSQGLATLRRTLEQIARGKAGTPDLYASLIDLDLLRPVVLDAGSVHYSLDRLEDFDAVAWALDIDQLVETAAGVFPDETPWDTVAIGEETWTSDSYPIYYFPRPLSKQRPKEEDDYSFYWELNHNRRTDWVDVFVSQTFSYVVQASRSRQPYLCSALRLPVVAATIEQLNGRFNSFAQGSLNALDREARRKLDEVNEFLGGEAMQSLRLPALAYVLDRSKGRKDLLSTLFRLRDEKQVQAFRQWCRASDRAWREQDMTGVYAAVRELARITEELAESASLQPIPGTTVRVPDPLVLVDRSPESVAALGARVVDAAYNPSLVFLRDFSSSAGDLRGADLEKLLERQLDDAEVKTYEQIYGRRQELYSSGSLRKEGSAVKVERMEVTMGDRFENVSNSIIATRGSIAKGIVTVREQGGEEVAKVLSELEEMIANLSSTDLPEERQQEALDLLQGITEEAGKPESNHSAIRALGVSLLGILGTVAPIAEAAKTAIESLVALFA